MTRVNRAQGFPLARAANVPPHEVRTLPYEPFRPTCRSPRSAAFAVSPLLGTPGPRLEARCLAPGAASQSGGHRHGRRCRFRGDGELAGLTSGLGQDGPQVRLVG